MPTPHPSLSSPAVITKSTKRSSLTPAPATRPRRHSLSTDPSTSPTEDESNEAFERISGILSSLIVEATEAVHGTDDDKSHILRRTGSRASLARPKSRLSLRWDSETDSDQSDDEEEVGQKSDSEASDSEHDAAVAAVTTTRLYYGQSDAEEDEADSEEEWARGEDLENVRKSPMLVSAANVAVQAVDDEDDLCQSPKLLEDPSCRKLDAIEQARRRLLGLDSERAEQKVQPRSRPSSWSSSASTSVDEPTPSPSTSWSRRSLGEVPTPTVSSSRSRRGFVDPPKPTVSTSRSNRSTVEPPVPNPSTSSCSRRSMIESPTPTRSSSRSRSSMVESPTPTPSSSSASRRSLLRPKHMSFDINPNNELLESMKRVDDSLAEIDSLSKDLAGENDYDDASPENIAIVTANGSLPNPATATTSRWRNISTDADKISFAVQRQQAQHPSQGPPSPTAQSSAPVFSFLESFTPSMRARIITSILFSLLHIPHAFVAESLSNVAAAFNSSPAKFSLPYMADSAPLCIANVLTWTIFFTVGSFMVDSMTGGSVASIADVWRQNGFVKHGVRGRVIASKVNADDDEILLQEGEGDAYHRPSRVRRLAKDGVAHEPSIGEAGVPGGYYPTKSEYDSCMPLDKGDMAGMFPGTYYYRCVCDGGMRKPNETPLREDERKHDGPVRHRHVEYTHHSLPATFRPENCATGGSVAPLRRALHAATQKRVMVVHDLDGGKTDVIAMENAKEGAEGEVLEVVVVKRKRAGTGASIGKGGVLLVGRRNSL
ncbi:hypothetical protein BC938DRAFT_474881 [Jimgerdemannia flammicorona]|nr:hypothetical protein BC938DRAFT_474881 [Jimgerdemannia flammicorona]